MKNNCITVAPPVTPNGGWTKSDPDKNSVFFDAGDIDDIVDINKMMKCFSNIPDAGATFEVKLCVDVPSNNNPNSLWTIKNKAGHAFITMSKTNGSQSATQSFGFYPETTLSAISMSPQPSKIHNDGDHEYNASIKIPNLNAADFQQLINAAITNSTVNYDLDNHNCADYAVDVFNTVNSPNIQCVSINQYLPPASYMQFGGSPSGLYQSLAKIKNGGGSNASNIELGVLKKSVKSNGECN